MENKKGILLFNKCFPTFFLSIDTNLDIFKNNDFDIKASIEEADFLLWYDDYFSDEEKQLYQKLLDRLIDKIKYLISHKSSTYNWFVDFIKDDEGEYLIDLMSEYDIYNPEILIKFNDETEEGSDIHTVKEYVKKKIEEKNKIVEKIILEFLQNVQKIQYEIILNHPYDEEVPRDHYLSCIIMVSTLFWEYAIKLLDEDVIDLRGTLINKLAKNNFPIVEMFNLLQNENIEII